MTDEVPFYGFTVVVFYEIQVPIYRPSDYSQVITGILAAAEVLNEFLRGV